MEQPSYCWTGQTFLIADDDPYSYLLLDKVLKKTEQVSFFASNGEEALNKLLENKNISVAILDIIMPKMNGYEVVEKIKKNPIRYHIHCLHSRHYKVQTR
jgi:CheY-like chemotaxis protein